jgi:O-antigen ligase
MEQIELKTSHRVNSFARYLMVIMPVFLVLVFANKANLYTLLAIAMIALIYGFFRDKLFYFFAFSLPALAFGQIVHIPLTPTWVYDATLAEVLLTATVIVFLFDKFVSRSLISIKLDNIALALAVYTGIGILSIFYAGDLELFVAGMKVITYSLAAYFLALNLLDSKRKIDFFYASLAVCVLILSFQIFHTFYSMGFSSKFFFNRSDIQIPLGAIALVSAILAMLLPAILARMSIENANKAFRLLLVGAFISGVMAVFLMLGKGAIIALMLGLAYFLHTARKYRFIFIVSLLLFACVSFIMFMPYVEGLLERIRNTAVDTNFKFRKEEFRVGWKIIKDHPLIGVGAGQQLRYYQQMIDPNYRNYANNFILQSSIDFGLAGISALLLIMLAIRSKVRIRLKSKSGITILSAGIVASLIVSLANGMIEVTFFALPYAVSFWAVMGLFTNLQHDADPLINVCPAEWTGANQQIANN